MNRKYVLKNRRRFYLFIMLATITISFTVFAATVNGADTGESYINVIVEKGDTLWDLAREYNKNGDIRQYINKIEKANNLTGSVIVAGDILKLPV